MPKLLVYLVIFVLFCVGRSSQINYLREGDYRPEIHYFTSTPDGLHCAPFSQCEDVDDSELLLFNGDDEVDQGKFIVCCPFASICEDTCVLSGKIDGDRGNKTRLQINGCDCSVYGTNVFISVMVFGAGGVGALVLACCVIFPCHICVIPIAVCLSTALLCICLINPICVPFIGIILIGCLVAFCAHSTAFGGIVIGCGGLIGILWVVCCLFFGFALDLIFTVVIGALIVICVVYVLAAVVNYVLVILSAGGATAGAIVQKKKEGSTSGAFYDY